MDNDLITAGQISDEFTLMSLFFRADLVVKLVILILFAASIFSWTIIIHKIRLFRSLNKLTKSFEEIFWSGKSLKSISLDAADISDSPIRSVFLDAIDEVEKSKTISSKNYESVSKRIERVMDASIDLETEKLSENFGYLATIGSTTPFIGLFGTVWGIMNSFQSIAISRNTSLAIVAPGIAEALFATALGLLAAIPAVVAYNKFNTDSKKYSQKLENFSKRFLTII
jgi:biopolymer transport protein TolQ